MMLFGIRSLSSSNLTRPLRGLAALSLLLVSSSSADIVSPARSSDWYYKIGGAEAISAAANRNVTTVTLGGALDLGLGYNCGNFNPVLGVTNILNNVKSGAEQMMQQMVTAATGAIASLPALILQRANPGLYDLFHNALLRAQATISLATKSCEQMQQEIAQGKNPFDRWITLAKGYDWKLQMGTGGVNSSPVDVASAKDTVENNSGSNGVPWLGGIRAGGLNQPPIRVITDTVRAGYNIELGRSVTDPSAAPTDGTAPALAKMWKTPSEATAFAVYVLGDADIRTQKNSPRNATPGHGLLPKIEQDKATLLNALTNLVNGGLDPTPANLEKVSSPGTLMTREVIEAIRKLPTAQEQAVAMGKLAGEAATALNLERALMLRRLLLTGRMEPNIFASEAGDDIEQAIVTLTRDIDNVLYEARVRREVFAQTSGVLLDLSRAVDGEGRVSAPARTHDVKPVQNGAVH
jgi:integrating conjugative element protein (TIGR03755 family)